MDEVEEISTPKISIARQNCYFSVVPWQNAEQFVKVYEKLYSPSISDKRWAVDQISVWETRCHPSLPTAIEATVVIVGAIIQDMLLEVGKTLCRERDIQTLYSMAIVRFINLILQTEGKNLTILADQHNIPRWVLDLRHDATHANVPPLALLRMGAKFAMTYLEDTYWKKEMANVCQIVKTPSGLEGKVVDVISKFKNVQFSIKEEIGEISELERDLHELIENIHSLVKNHKEKFVEALVKPGLFLSAENIIRLLTYTKETIFLERNDLLTLPNSLLTFWLAVIRILHTADLISYFAEMLLLSLQHCTNVLCQKTTISWVGFLMNETSPKAPPSVLSNRFKAKGVQLYPKRLLYACMKAPNMFTQYAARAILNRFEGEKKYSHLLCIFAVQLGIVSENTKTVENKDSLVFTAEDFDNDYYEGRLKEQGLKKQKNIWSMAPVTMNFANLPLGAIIHSEIPVQNGVETQCEDVDMDAGFEEKYIIEENDKEPTVEVKRTPDINQFFQDPDIGDMMYSR